MDGPGINLHGEIISCCNNSYGFKGGKPLGEERSGIPSHSSQSTRTMPRQLDARIHNTGKSIWLLQFYRNDDNENFTALG